MSGYQGRVRLESWQPSEPTKSERMKHDFKKYMYFVKEVFFLKHFEVWLMNACQIDWGSICLIFSLIPSDHE